MDRTERVAARLALGRDGVYSEATAVELMPFGDAKSRAWLRKRQLVRFDAELGRYVIWGEVLEALRQETPPPPSRSAPDLPRKKLR